MTVCCPDCLEPVGVPPTAREGRCEWCRPQRQHSGKRMDTASQFQQFMHRHSQATQ